MSKVEELKAELAALEPGVASIPDNNNPEPQETIADDEVQAFMASENESRAKSGMASFSKPLTLERAKELFLEQRLSEKLFAIVSDESKPMPERIAALRRMRAEKVWPNNGRAPYADAVAGLKDEEAVECFVPHPHKSRMKELYDFINDPAQRTELQPWELRIQACREFRTLRAQYPSRYVGCHLSSDAEANVAYWYARNAPEHGKSRHTYRMILERGGQNTSVSAAISSDSGAKPKPQTVAPEPEPAPKPRLDPETFWQYQQWKAIRQAQGLTATVAEFLKTRE